MVRHVLEVKKMSIAAVGIGTTVDLILKNRAQLVIALERMVQTVQCLSNNVAVCRIKGIAGAAAKGSANPVTDPWFVA